MIENYIAKTISCSCGREHKSRVETIVIEHGVINRELINFLKQHSYNRLTVVCDNKSYAVAGKAVCDALSKAKIHHKLHLFKDDALAPNEHAIGNLAMGMDLDCDLILAVGSGTINDICRYVSAVAGRPFCTVGTAPSMDGYISGSSALIYNNFKLTFETKAPQAVFFDPDILAHAPKDMIASGVGDLLGKINCLTDWKLSEIVTGEWHCDFISDIVDTAIEKTISVQKGIESGDDKAVATLLEALLLSGVCMDYAGNSRPASGSEHHLSHFLEMRYLLEGRKAVFHGTKVGIGTIITLKAYEYVSTLCPNFEKLKNMSRISFSDWKNNILTAYKDAAGEIIDLEQNCRKNGEERLKNRLCSIESNWDRIKSLALDTTKSEVVENILSRLNAPTLPSQIGVEKGMTKDAILYAKEIRDRYTVLQLLWDLDELENFADMIINQYYS